MYRIYSDYSMSDTESSYAYVVVYCQGNKNRAIHKFGSRKLRLKHSSTIGEFMGSLAGLRKVPDGHEVRIYTDIHYLPFQLRTERTSFIRKSLIFRRLKKEFNFHKKRLGNLDIVYLAKGNRPHFYHWCHKKARSRIIENAKQPRDLSIN